MQYINLSGRRKKKQVSRLVHGITPTVLSLIVYLIRLTLCGEHSYVFRPFT